MGTNERHGFTEELIEAAKQKIDSLPDTPPRRGSQRTAAEVIAELRSRIRKRRRQGYSWEQIAEELKAVGMAIPASTIKYHSRPKKPIRRRTLSDAVERPLENKPTGPTPVFPPGAADSGENRSGRTTPSEKKTQ